jgi:hypothetical protein
LMEHVDRMPEDLTRIFCYRSKWERDIDFLCVFWI